jgi:large subunit ribosomal protein L10
LSARRQSRLDLRSLRFKGMPTKQKTTIVEQFEKEARESKGLIVTSFKSLKTVEFNEMRSKLRPLKSEYRVVKNSLTRIALKNAGLAQLAEMFQGPTALVIERGDPIAATKAVFEFAKTHENLKINGGFFDGKVVSGSELKAIAALPSRDVLLAILLGTLQAPLVNLVSVLQAPVRDLVNVLDALSKKEEKK